MAYKRYKSFRLTPIWMVIILNLLFFIATAIAPELILILGLQPASFPHRPWTILSSLFVHSGLWHIVANMLTLYFFSRYLSRLIGESKLLITYFCGGIAGSGLFILLALLTSPYSIAVGASGAIFALGGTLTVMRPRLKVLVFPIPTPIPLWAAIIGGFLIISLLPYIAWQAHLGGLILGIIAGYFFRKRERLFS